MASEEQGIMSLPQGGQGAEQNAPALPLSESYDAIMQGLQNASPQASADVQQMLAQMLPQLDQLSDEDLDMFLQAIQYLYEGGEKEYAKRLQEVVAGGMLDAGDLPEDFDPELLSAIGTVLLQAQQSRQAGNERAAAMEPPPQQFARGGIADAARMVASQGRSGDTMLAHINPSEARMLRKQGGVGTINPKTGLPEFFLKKAFKAVTGAVKSVVKGVVGAVKKVLKSPIGRILATVALATFLGPAGAAMGGGFFGAGTAAALASGTVTALGGGNLKQVLTSAATAYLGAPGGPVANYVGAAGITNVAANAAVSSGLVGTGIGLLTGQKLQDAVKTGLTAATTSGLIAGVQSGFGANTAMGPQQPVPGQEGLGPDFNKYLSPDQVQAQIAQGGAPAPTAPLGPTGDYSTDPFGGMPTAGAPAPATQGPLTTPVPNAQGQMAPAGAPQTAMQSMGRIGGGIADLAQGNFSDGFGAIKSGAGELFSPTTYSPQELQQSDVFQQARSSGATYTEALKQAEKALNPGMLRSYGPITAAGLGIAGLAGGFQAKPLPPSELAQKLSGTPGEDLIKADPSKYLTQNLPGVEYDSSGNIIGSKPWQPSATLGDVRVASNRTPSTIGGYTPMQIAPPTMYQPGMNAMSQGQGRGVMQQYNTPSMYDSLLPQYGPMMQAAQGGYADGGQYMTSDEMPVHMFRGGALQKALNSALRRGVQARPAPSAPVAPPSVSGKGFLQKALNSAIRQIPAMLPSSLRARLNPPRVNPSNLAGTAYGPEMGVMAGSGAYAPGIAGLAAGGYPRRNGAISGPGTEKSDSIPAMLSDGEFVMTAKAVKGAGNGSRRAGAKKMYALMHQLERNASRG